MSQLSEFIGLHYGEAMVVCGLGASINSFHDPQRFRTIGVNDIGRAFTPNYLFVMDSPKSFGPERFQFIQNTQATWVFTDHELGLSRGNVVRFPIHKSPVYRFDDPTALYLTGRPCTSPLLALCLAAHLGAKAIGLIGVDFTDGHFFASDGPHKLADKLVGINKRYYRLGSALLERGVKIFNLSAQSRLTAFPRLDLEEFHALQKRGRSRSWSRSATRVCFVSKSPPSRHVLAMLQFLNSRTAIACRLIAPRSPDLSPASSPDIERDVLATAAVTVDCRRIRVPKKVMGDSACLRTWNKQLRPLLLGKSRSRASLVPERTYSLSVFISQENATGHELIETLRSVRRDLSASDDIFVLGRVAIGRKTAAWLRRTPGVRYLEQMPGEGWIALRNRAAGESRKDILVFANAHTQTPAHWVDGLLDAFDYPRVAAAGPVFADMYDRDSKGYGMTWSDPTLRTEWLPKIKDAPYAVPLLPNPFIAVRRSALRRVGGFDEGMLGSGGEEADLCFRFWTGGFQCALAPRSEILWMNPFTSGVIRNNEHWGDLLYNLLRLATVHFGANRRDALLEDLSSDPQFPAAHARLVNSDAWTRRKSITIGRKYTDDWFFQRFSL